MKHISHFSFDLWFTLIKSNQTFKKERARYFFKHLNTLKKDIQEVERIFRQVDIMCNAINEKTGNNIAAEEMYLMVIYQLNNSLIELNTTDINNLYTEMEALFLNYPPVLFSLETKDCLEKIKQDSDNTINILSNTAFIKGCTLKSTLHHLDIHKYFNFQIYSDEIGYSKPNPLLFNILLDTIFTLKKNKQFNLKEIIHIGDNPIADIFGAELVGINAFQINTNDKLITHLLN